MSHDVYHVFQQLVQFFEEVWPFCNVWTGFAVGMGSLALCTGAQHHLGLILRGRHTQSLSSQVPPSHFRSCGLAAHLHSASCGRLRYAGALPLSIPQLKSQVALLDARKAWSGRCFWEAGTSSRILAIRAHHPTSELWGQWRVSATLKVPTRPAHTTLCQFAVLHGSVPGLPPMSPFARRSGPPGHRPCPLWRNGRVAPPASLGSCGLL